jgi:hypothetical protein
MNIKSLLMAAIPTLAVLATLKYGSNLPVVKQVRGYVL